MDRERSSRPGGDRRPPRDDTRNHKARYDKERSRSPPRRDHRDDRGRDRSPPRGPTSRSGPAPPRSDRDRDFQRRDAGPPRGRSDVNKPPPRDQPNNRSSGTAPGRKGQQKADVKMEEAADDEDSDAAMKRIMGFSDFRSTKNTKVPGNDKNHGVHKVRKTEYRQYMNRVGGFNRPLEAM